MANLEDKTIRTWIKNNTRFEGKSDGGGLYVRYRESDSTPIWFIRFKIAKIQQRLIIGRYPGMTLKAARIEAKIQRGEILKGNNPAATKREAKRETAAKAIAEQSAQTVLELVDEFFTRNINGKCKTAKAMRQRVDNYLIPVIGKMRVEDVEPMHISKMLNRIIDAGAPTTANDVLGYSKRIFNYAIKRQIIKNNPASAFDFSDAGGKESKRDRYLNQNELTALFKAMHDAEKFTDHHYTCTKLLLLLGCRKSELLKSKLGDFDLNKAVWCMSKDNKSKLPINIPLPEPALVLISKLINNRIDSSECLIPSMGKRTSKTGHIDEGYLNKPLKNFVIPLMGDIEHFTIHDFRATLKTNLSSKQIMGLDRFVGERCLNHVIQGMEGVYDRGDYFEERKEALTIWAAFLDSCENGTTWNVIPIRKQA